MYNLRKPNIRNEICINIHNKSIEKVNCVISNLSGVSHLDKVCKKLGQLCYLLYHVRKTLDMQSLKSIYDAFAVSNIAYGILYWGRSSEAKIVFILQKKIIRIMFNMKYGDTCRKVFEEHEILTYYGIYYYELIMYFKKHENVMEENKNQHTYQTRAKNNNE